MFDIFVFNFFLFLDLNKVFSLLCLRPSLDLITRKDYMFAFGLHRKTVKRNSTKEFPALSKHLQNAFDEMDLFFQNEKNLLDENIENIIAQRIKILNDNVSIIVLGETANLQTANRAPLSILKAPYFKTPPRCNHNISTTYAPMLTINHVSI